MARGRPCSFTTSRSNWHGSATHASICSRTGRSGGRLLRRSRKARNWWWKSGDQSLTRYNVVLEAPPSRMKQSVSLGSRAEGTPPLWAISSTPVLPGAGVRVVNFASTESAERYGPQVADWIKRGEKVIYVGPLPSGSRVAGLDGHFAGERFKIGDDDAQVVQIGPGDKVLAEHEGKPWAKRSGNLLIVARWPAEIKDNSNEPLPTIDLGWLREFLSAGGGSR